MNDYINRQAAIDALHMDTSIIPFKKAREYADATISEIRNRLEKLPSVQPKRWIPVTERLPEEKQDVLLAFKHNMVVGFWEDILNDGGQAWYANSGNGWFTETEAVDDDGFPLAWMPLPEPYTSGADMRG